MPGAPSTQEASWVGVPPAVGRVIRVPVIESGNTCTPSQYIVGPTTTRAEGRTCPAKPPTICPVASLVGAPPPSGTFMTAPSAVQYTLVASTARPQPMAWVVASWTGVPPVFDTFMTLPGVAVSSPVCTVVQ